MSAPVCYARRCGAERGGDKIMCRKHWAMVPEDLQREIYAANRERALGRPRSLRTWIERINEARDLVSPIEQSTDATTAEGRPSNASAES